MAVAIKYWKIDADSLSKDESSWGWVSGLDREGQTKSRSLTSIAMTKSVSLGTPMRS